MTYTTPDNNEAEITLIGTGGGYGESCVIHLGNQHWIVVDSCVDPHTQKSLPLQYLKDIGVDLSTQVKAVICTHWHNDHIMGLSNLLDECESAFLGFARATDKEKFTLWIEFDYDKIFGSKYSCSTNEFRQCLAIARARNQKIKVCYPDRTLISIADFNVCVYSLSPSDLTMEEFDRHIGSLMTEYADRASKYEHTRPNDNSVVLLLKLGEHCALLGADLEVSSSNLRGWLNILDQSQVIQGKKSSLFKIPHHGSENGYHTRVWSELLLDKPVGKGSPWNRGRSLPQPNMIQQFLLCTDKLYYTAGVKMNNKSKARSKEAEKIISFFNDSVKEVKYSKGLIRSRIKMNETSAVWATEVEGQAFHVNAVLI